jgi:hypothetical protein
MRAPPVLSFGIRTICYPSREPVRAPPGLARFGVAPVSFKYKMVQHKHIAIAAAFEVAERNGFGMRQFVARAEHVNAGKSFQIMKLSDQQTVQESMHLQECGSSHPEGT